MGYDAYVHCDCYKQGKTPKPPHEEYIVFDEEGLYLHVPGLYEKDQEKFWEMENEFEQWKRSACPHEDMEIASEHLANIMGMGAFRTLVAEMGGSKRFPVLSKYLPTSNGGCLPWESAGNLLRELADLEAEKTKEMQAVLIEKSSGEVLHSVNAEKVLFFVYSAGNERNCCLDKDGFFIVVEKRSLLKTRRLEVFRSMHFRQEKTGINQYLFTDIPSGKKYKSKLGIMAPESPLQCKSNEFLVEIRGATIADEYSYIIPKLKKLAHAAIQTKNPIHWC